MNLIDTHLHYNSYIYDDLDAEIIKLNNNKNVSKVINVGLDYNTSREALKNNVFKNDVRLFINSLKLSKN